MQKMKNTQLLFDNTLAYTKGYKICDGRVIIECKFDTFNGASIKKVISIINGLNRLYPAINIPIDVNLGTVRFQDKLTYVILECIFYHLIRNRNQDIRVYMDPVPGIDVEGIMSSPLMLLSSSKVEKRAIFAEKFEFEIYQRHFRRIVHSGDIDILDELNYFLKVFDIDEDNREDICEVISELISNGTEHAEGECLIDIDVTDLYGKIQKNKEVNGSYYGINIVVLNLSEKLLGTQIKNKILSEKLDTERYKSVYAAYVYHSQYFNDNYTEEDFFNMAVFQHRISGRQNEEMTGGTGLTLLIKSLESKSDSNFCYVLSGKRVLGFKQKYLEYKNDWIGFNESNDFLNDIPDLKNITDCDIKFPGTAYNLHFIMEKK